MTGHEPIDVASLVKDWLKSELATRFPELTVTIGEPPARWTRESPPALVIEDDGDPLVMWPVATSPTIRITSWTSRRDRTYVHAAMTRLLTGRIPKIKLLRGTGFLDARDDKTRGHLASFTVRARARTATPQ